MKKNYTFLHLSNKVWMLISALLLSGVVTARSVDVHHQTISVQSQQDYLSTRVTISAKNSTLTDFINALQKKLGNKVFLNMSLSNVEDNRANITIDVKDQPLRDLLVRVLGERGLTFTEKGNVVMIVKKGKAKIPSITVKIVDQKSRQPIIGAVIYEVGGNNGSAADHNGNATLKNVTEGTILEVSSIGYAKLPLLASADMNNKTIELAEESVGVEEVVVTGYQTVSRRDMVASTTTLKADDVMIPSYTTIDQMLQGQVAGMMVTSSSARAGASPKIQIRGTSTLMGNQDPIWVVDGVIQDDPISINASTFMADDMRNIIGNQISWLNPTDIETITVLKDASATAIYGSRASNGVIVVTLKKGKEGRLSINYSGNLSVTGAPNYGQFNMMNSQERIRFGEEAYSAGARYEEQPIKQAHTYEGILRMMLEGDISRQDYLTRKHRMELQNTDWLDLLTRPAFSHNHNLSVSGASDKANYTMSVGYAKNNGQEINDSNERMTSRAQIGLKLAPNLKVDFSVNGSFTTNHGFGRGISPLNYALKTSRAIAPYDENGDYLYYRMPARYQYNTNTQDLGYNILNEIENSGSQVKNGRMSTSLNLSWDIVKGLTYKFSGGYAYGSLKSSSYMGERTFDIANKYRGYDFGSSLPGSPAFKAALLPFGGELFTSDGVQQSWNVQNMLTYSKIFNEDNRLNVMLGHEVRSSRNNNVSSTVWGYIPERGNMLVAPTSQNDFTPIGTQWSGLGPLFSKLYNGSWRSLETTDNFMSLFATVAYSFKNRYVFNANIRNDVSNRFGQDVNNRFDPTYSFGLSWRVTQEEFMKNIDWLTNLNLRATYGIQGNALLNQSPELLLRQQNVKPIYNEYFSSIVSIPNPNLSWERTQNWDLGLELSLFRQVDVVVDYYSRKSNAIVNQAVPSENGIAFMDLNGGLVYNKGLEVTVNLTPVKTRDFTFNLSVNGSKNWNRTGAANEAITVGLFLNGNSSIIVKEGYPVGALWSYKLAGLDGTDGSPLFDFYGVNTANYNGDPSSFLTYSGSSTPLFTGGLNLNLMYKQWSLGTSFTMLLGGKKRLTSPYSEFASGSYIPNPSYNLNKDLLDRWKKPGDENHTNIPGLMVGNPYMATPVSSLENKMEMYAKSDALIVNSSFLRCKNLMLSYRLTDKMAKKIGINNMSVNGSVSNLFVIADKRFKGFDPELQNSVMPRTFTLGLTLGF